MQQSRVNLVKCEVFLKDLHMPVAFYFPIKMKNFLPLSLYRYLYLVIKLPIIMLFIVTFISLNSLFQH